MTKASFFCGVLLSLAVTAFADDLTLSDGRVFKDYQVSKTEPDGLTIRHSTGIAKLYFWELPEELQKQYKYDPQKARDYNQKAKAQQAAAAAQQQEAARRAKQKREFEAAHAEVMQSIKKGALQMQGKVQQITSDGALIQDALAVRTYQYQEEVPPPPGYTPLGRTFVTRTATDYARVAAEYEPVFVLGAGSGFTDGAGWSATAYPAGTYRYTTVQGAGKTVKCFALSPEAALEYMLKIQ